MAHSQHTIPTLTVCGQCGAGKSSLINALVHADMQAVGVTPTTRAPKAYGARTDSGIPVHLLDTPGIGESGHEEYATSLSSLVPHTDMLIWVVGFDNRALEQDVQLLREIRHIAYDKPLLILGNAVDRVSRHFNPDAFDVTCGSSPEEAIVRNWLAYLNATFAFAAPTSVLACAAGECCDDTARQYNLKAVSRCIEEMLPEAMRLRWLEEEKTNSDRKAKAERMILAATATAGTIGLLPLPVADVPLIITTQVTLILSLCSLYGRTFSADTARSLALAALSAIAGPMVFHSLSKCIPAFGSVVGASVASACTYAVGTVTLTMLNRDEDFDLNTFKKAVRDVFHDYRQGHK